MKLGSSRQATPKRAPKKPAAPKCSHCAKPFTDDNLVGIYVGAKRYHMSCAIRVGVVVVS